MANRVQQTSRFLYNDENHTSLLAGKSLQQQQSNNVLKPSQSINLSVNPAVNRPRMALGDISNRNAAAAAAGNNGDIKKSTSVPIAAARSTVIPVAIRSAVVVPVQSIQAAVNTVLVQESATSIDNMMDTTTDMIQSAVSTSVPAPTASIMDTGLFESRLSTSIIDSHIMPYDAVDSNNSQLVTEYIGDIMSYFRSTESRRHPSSDYMLKQTDITYKMREILIDWLIEVHLKFKLSTETLYLTINIIDRFLERRLINRNKLQLIGCTSMLIASKYEEIYSPEINDFVHIADKAYSRDNILQMEQYILNTLSFNLTLPTSYRFSQRFIKIGLLDCNNSNNSANTELGSDADNIQYLTNYLLELQLQEYSFLKYLPSILASSALLLARTTILTNNNNTNISINELWNNILINETKYTIQSLFECCSDYLIISNINSATAKYRAVRKKYSNKKFNEISKLIIKNPFELK